MWPRESFAHALPFEHGESVEPAITLTLLAVGVMAAILAGLFGSRAIVRAGLGAREAATAFALGALLLLFFDLVKETSTLGQALTNRPLEQAWLVLAFVAGLVGLALATRNANATARGAMLVAWAWTIGIALHGMGEAWIVGTEASNADITAPTQSASFLIHKAIEGGTILLVAGAILGARTMLAQAALVALAALAGAVGGLFAGASDAPNLLFAAGAGAAAWAIVLLARQTGATPRNAAWAAAGVVAIYLAGLLHQF